MTQPDIIVLAAGKSHRMGATNKLLLPIGDDTLLYRCLHEIEQIPQGIKIVVTGYEAGRVKELVDSSVFKTVHHAGFAAGMTSSIKAGIRELPPHSPGVMIVPADMPFARTADLRELCSNFATAAVNNKKTIVVASDKGVLKNPVIFSSHYYPQLLAHQNPNGCKQLVEQNREHVVAVEVKNPYFFRDIDTPEDYAALLDETTRRDR